MELSMDDLRRLSNSLPNRLGEEMATGAQLSQDVSLFMAWLKEMEDGSMVVTLDWLQKLEDQMAEKDAEMAALRGQLHLSFCHDWLRLNDKCFRCATAVPLGWRSRRRRS